QRPHPPVTIGGRGPTRTLRAAARWAQQWNAITSDPQDWLGLAETLRAPCAAPRRRPRAITRSGDIPVADGAAAREGAPPAARPAAAATGGPHAATSPRRPPPAPALPPPLADALAPLAG